MRICLVLALLAVVGTATSASGALSSAEATHATLTGRVAFSRADKIWVMNADGSGLKAVSRGPGDYSPSWSPDRRWIAFRSARAGKPSPEGVMIVPADGSKKERRLSNGYLAGFPDWSPDGQSIAFAGVEGIYSVAPDGSGKELLVPDGEWPAWSPDGEQMAFVRRVGDQNEIYVQTGSGSPLLLTQSIGSAYAPSWSPDSMQIVFSSDRKGQEDIYVVSPDGSGLRRLTSTTRSNESFPVWTADRGIAFATYARRGAQGAASIMNANGTARRPLSALRRARAQFPIDVLAPR